RASRFTAVVASVAVSIVCLLAAWPAVAQFPGSSAVPSDRPLPKFKDRLNGLLAAQNTAMPSFSHASFAVALAACMRGTSTPCQRAYCAWRACIQSQTSSPMGDDPAAALAGYAPCVPHLQVLNQCSDKYKEQQQALQTPEPSTPDPGPDTLPPTTESGVVPTYIQEEPVILVLGGPGVDATLPPIGIVSNSPSGSSGSPKP